MGIGKHFGSYTVKANKPKKERNYKEISWYQCQCSDSSQIPIQDDLNYHQFLSLYKLERRGNRTVLIMYDTENKKEEAKYLDDQIYLDQTTHITQLPNGELFCYGSKYSGITLIIDRNYRVRMLPSGINCHSSSALYFDNNIYCFGEYAIQYHLTSLPLSRKFDLIKKRWIDLVPLPKLGSNRHSVIFNRNILISGSICKNLWLYLVEIDSFSIIPYEFAWNVRKILINIEKLYLIEFYYVKEGLIYESEDEYHWKPISKWEETHDTFFITYCLYNKEKVYISAENNYYQFDLKKKVMSKLNTL